MGGWDEVGVGLFFHWLIWVFAIYFYLPLFGNNVNNNSNKTTTTHETHPHLSQMSARRRSLPLTYSYTCALNQVQCKEWRRYGPRCVPVANVCDGIYHCYDHSDEQNCGSQQFRARRLPNDQSSRYSTPFGLWPQKGCLPSLIMFTLWSHVAHRKRSSRLHYIPNHSLDVVAITCTDPAQDLCTYLPSQK